MSKENSAIEDELYHISNLQKEKNIIGLNLATNETVLMGESIEPIKSMIPIHADLVERADSLHYPGIDLLEKERM